MSAVDIATYVTALEGALLEFADPDCLMDNDPESLFFDIEKCVRVLQIDAPQCDDALKPLTRASVAIQHDMGLIQDTNEQWPVTRAYFQHAVHQCRALRIYNPEDLQTKCRAQGA